MESYLNSTYLIVGGFLIITLLMGLYAGRGIKTIDEYIRGGKSFNTFSLVLTFIATMIGTGTIIGGVNRAYNDGLIFLFASIAFTIKFLNFAFILGPRVARFKNALTGGDIMYQVYGIKMKVLTGVLNTLFTLVITAMQLGALGKLFNYAFGINSNTAIIACGLILGIYSAFGGIKSVTITDIFQFVVLFLAIPLVAAIALEAAGNYNSIFQNIPKEKLHIINHSKFYTYLTYVIIYPSILVHPPLVQRMLMINGRKQAKNKFLGVGVLHAIIIIVVAIIGFSCIALLPTDNSKNLLFHLIDSVITNPLLKGCILSGLIAVIMSTADSHMHSAGISLSHDVITPFKKGINEVFYARISTVVIVLLSIFLSVKAEYFVSTNIWANKLSSPILFGPMLLGVLGLKGSNKSLTFGIFSGLASFLISHFNLPTNIKLLAIPISLLANTITILFIHLIENKGFAWIKHDEEDKKKKQGIWVPTLEWA